MSTHTVLVLATVRGQVYEVHFVFFLALGWSGAQVVRSLSFKATPPGPLTTDSRLTRIFW